MYQEIASNKRKAIILIVLFAIIIVGLGWAFGEYYGSPSLGIILASLLATIMTLLGYFKGDAVSLLAAGAKPITKAEHPELYNTVENLAITTGLPTPKIYLIDDPAPNAFATGRSPEHASVAITTGLIRILNKQELQGVMAHEIAHIKNYDIRVMTLVVVLVGVILLLSDWLMRSFFFGRRGNDRSSGQLGAILMVIGVVLAILSPLFAELIKLAVSRSREYLADAEAALTTRYPEGLATALEKIAAIDRPLARANHATAHLFFANPFDPHKAKGKFSSFFSTHPPIEERIKRLRTMGR